MEYTLDNGTIRMGITTAGGSLSSLCAHGREYLWQPDPAVWTGQAPICFPICGGLRDGRAVTESGKRIELARHGFARKQEWKLAAQDKNTLTMSLASADHPELLEQYPYPFTIAAAYELAGASVKISYTVTNEGTEDMPFFIGGHPGFRCPLDAGESYTDYELRFEAPEAETLCCAVPSTGLIAVEHRSANPMTGKILPLTRELFSFAETVFDVLESRTVTFSKKGEDKGVRLSFVGFPYLIIWGKPEGDFVAIEPWSGLSTCSDEDDVFEHKRGCLVAAPGESVTRSFTIEIL